MINRSYLSLIILGSLSTQAIADDIFTDNFNSGLGNWNVSGSATTNSNYVIDGLSAYLKQTGSIETEISLIGYENIVLEYQMASRLLEASDYCFAEYSLDNGNNFNQLSSLGNGQDSGNYYAFQHSIAESNSLIVRFRAQTGTADHCYIENVKVSGSPISTVTSPQIEVEANLNFGSVVIGSLLEKSLPITNTGSEDLLIQPINFSSSSYTIVQDTCSTSTLAKDASCNISVQFAPDTSGGFNDSININSNDPESPSVFVTLSGTGAQDSSEGYIENYEPLTGSGSVARSQLSHSVLNSNNEISTAVNMQAFALPSEAAQPEHNFEGTLTLIAPETAGIGQFIEHKDSFRYTGNSDDPRKHIPDFSFEFVQSGTHLIPKSRGINLSNHEYWEYILEPGRVWKENNDNGDSRAAIPFALMQKNSNCVHNGLMSFTFSDNSISQVFYQISSETCLYYQFDTWGSADATYTKHSVSDSLALKQAHQLYEASKVETRAISELATDYPAANLNLNNIASSSEVTPANMSVYGVYYNGVHYRAGCETRHGTYPYCDRLRVPSYSTAKTAFAGTVSMRLEALYPGYMSSELTNLVPETANDPENDWQDVTPNNAIDMATGNYRLSSSSMSDESSTANDTGFFLVLDHQNKLDYSVSRYPRKAAPGTKFIYHTTDTYIATVAAQNFIQSQRGSDTDIFDDVLVSDIWSPLNIDLGSQDTRRTYDGEKMPFGGFGLTFLSDDIVKISKFTSIDEGSINGEQMLNQSELSEALFRDPTSPPLATTIDRKYYANSMWGKSIELTSNCEVIIPFMSGYGGIQFVMMPNDIIYYYVSDNDEFYWDGTAIELNKLNPYCN